MEVESDKETGLEKAEIPMRMSALSVLYGPVTVLGLEKKFPFNGAVKKTNCPQHDKKGLKREERKKIENFDPSYYQCSGRFFMNFSVWVNLSISSHQFFFISSMFQLNSCCTSKSGWLRWGSTCSQRLH